MIVSPTATAAGHRPRPAPPTASQPTARAPPRAARTHPAACEPSPRRRRPPPPARWPSPPRRTPAASPAQQESLRSALARRWGWAPGRGAGAGPTAGRPRQPPAPEIEGDVSMLLLCCAFAVTCAVTSASSRCAAVAARAWPAMCKPSSLRPRRARLQL